MRRKEKTLEEGLMSLELMRSLRKGEAQGLPLSNKHWLCGLTGSVEVLDKDKGGPVPAFRSFMSYCNLMTSTYFTSAEIKWHSRVDCKEGGLLAAEVAS